MRVTAETARRGLPWGPITQLALTLATLAAIAVLGAVAFAFADNFAEHANFPFGHDYGEGPILFQLAALSAGESIYQPIATPPYAVSNYPPVFHALAWLANRFIADPLLAGRVVSFVGALAAGLLVFALASGALHRGQPRMARYVAGVLAGLFFLSHVTVIGWASMMRVDNWALAFSLLGMQLFVMSLRRPWLAWVCGLVFLLAVFTKPSVVAAAAATFATGLVIARPQALRAIAMAIVGGIVVMGLFTWWTGGEFPLHILLYNVNPFRPDLFHRRMIETLTWRPVDVLVLLGMATLLLAYLVRRFRGEGGGGAGRDPALLLFGLFLAASLFNVIGSGKTGASVSYFLEFEAATSLLVGLAAIRLAEMSRAADWGPHCLRLRLFGAIGLGMLCWQGAVGWDIKFRGPDWGEVEFSQRAAERLAQAEGPVVSEDLTLLYRSGKPLYYQPFIMTQLARVGRWSPDAFVEDIWQGRVGAILIYSDIGSLRYHRRFPPGFDRALKARYRLEQRFGFYSLYVPR